MRHFIEQYVGAMVLRSDGQIVRREAETRAETNTAPAQAEAVVKQSTAGARPLPLHAMTNVFWERLRNAI